jgi:hypothetical protein
MEGVGFEPTKAEPADLQSAPFGRLGTPPHALLRFFSFPSRPLSPEAPPRGRRGDSNPGPTDYKSVALPTELHRQAPDLTLVSAPFCHGPQLQRPPLRHQNGTLNNTAHTRVHFRAIGKGRAVYSAGTGAVKTCARAAHGRHSGRQKPPNITSFWPSAAASRGRPEEAAAARAKGLLEAHVLLLQEAEARGAPGFARCRQTS